MRSSIHFSCKIFNLEQSKVICKVLPFALKENMSGSHTNCNDIYPGYDPVLAILLPTIILYLISNVK